MQRVRVAIWMWSGKDMGPEWQVPDDLRATMDTEVAPGTTAGGLFARLAEQYPPIREKVFVDSRLSPHVIVTLNRQGIHKDDLLAKVLADGDVITVLPLIVGG